MSRKSAFPFLVLTDEVVTLDNWLIGDPEQPLAPAGDLLEDWDYARDLEVANCLQLDWPAISHDLQLPEEALKLRVVLVAGTGNGTLPRRQLRILERVVDASTTSLPIEAVLQGHKLSGRLRLSIVITLEAPLQAGTVLSPRLRGSRLWQSDHDILIEDGGDSRFPMETLSFSNAFKGRRQEHSPWYLHWHPGSLDADFASAVRLYINSDMPETFARFVAGDRSTLQAIMGDVISQVIGAALESKETDLSACEDGSLGSQTRIWLESCFPGETLGGVKAVRDADPGCFRAAILSFCETGEA